MTGRASFRKKVVTDERLEKVNPKNMNLIAQFLKEKSTRTSPTTIEVYRSNLHIFFVWNMLYNDNKFYVDIKKIEISDFFVYATDTMKLGSSRQNNLRSTLSSLSNFIIKFYDEDYPEFRNNILNIIETAPKEFRRKKTILSDEEVQLLLDTLEKDKPQEACWVALASCSGARFSEILRWEVDLIDENNTAFGDIFLETTREIKTKGRGKSGKMIYKYIIKDKFLPYYNAWLGKRAEILKENGLDHNFLFIKQNGEPATPSVIDGWTRGFTKILGKPIYAHAFRHYLTTLLLYRKIPTNFIQALFGWESSDMVEVYSDLSVKDLDWSEEMSLLKDL